MHELHRAFTNARFGRQCDYTEYLSTFADLSAVPQPLKLTAAYRCARLALFCFKGPFPCLLCLRGPFPCLL
jgi:hypothetical protein